MNATCCAPCLHCSKMESESSCGIAHHMSLLKLTWISQAPLRYETVGPAGTARLESLAGLGCSVADPVGQGGPAGTARLDSMSMSGCSVADLVGFAPAMVLRRRLREASPRAASPTKQSEQRAIIQARQSRLAEGRGDRASPSSSEASPQRLGKGARLVGGWLWGCLRGNPWVRWVGVLGSLGGCFKWLCRLGFGSVVGWLGGDG